MWPDSMAYQMNPPPPASSAMSAYGSPQSAPTHYSHAHRMSRTEGVAKTGQPEVVGDISSWKAQQAQAEEQKHNSAYPDLNELQPSKSDGYAATGGVLPFCTRAHVHVCTLQLA